MKNDNTAKITASIATIIYLVIYIFNWFIWSGVIELGKGLSGGSHAPTSPFREFAGACVGSMTFAFIPCVLATIFSIISKKTGLICFNVIFLAINIFFFYCA